MNEPNEDESFKILQRKADAFFVLKRIVHVTLKNDRWKRGTIIDVGADFLIMEERLEGQIPVFFLEIKDIDAFRGDK